MEEVKKILIGDDMEKQLALFQFHIRQTDEMILLKFNLWARFFFPKYFKSDDAKFHELVDLGNLHVYRGDIWSFTDIAFREGAKTTRTKLFIAYCILNDTKHHRRYIKVLSKDLANSKQIVTDIYNMFVAPKVQKYYPDTFKKSDTKREETMSAFTTYTGIKMIADTVGTDQRGQLQEDARPDLILFEDIETRMTLRSAVTTKTIWDNMEEARRGLAKGGGCIYNCNYISELGNVHKLVEKENELNRVLITPIIKNGVSQWDRYSLEYIEQLRQDAEDFEGEYLCQPSASKDILFDRETLDNMPINEPVKELAGFKIFKEYDPSHRYGAGHDVAGGVGLDSSTTVIIDFSSLPAQVVATFKSDTIKPDIFGDEIQRQVNIFAGCISAPEKNNYGHATIARMKQLEMNMYRTRSKDTKISNLIATEFGWHTNADTKPRMLFALKKAIEDGHLKLNDKDLIAEIKSYSRNDLMENEKDPSLTTRHFDLLIACAIAWQMKDYAEVKDEDSYNLGRPSKAKENMAR